MSSRRKLIVVLMCLLSLPVQWGEQADAAAPIPIYVFAGQSNMTGAYAKAAELPAVAHHLVMPQKRVLFWGPTSDLGQRWAAIRPPTEIHHAVFRNGFGPELAAAYRLSRATPATTMAVFKFSRNGSNLYSQWNPDDVQGYYRQMMNKLAYARRQLTADTGRPTRIAAFFWMQGESDANTREHAAAYGRNLMKLIARVRADAGNAKLPVVLGRILDLRKWYHSLSASDMVRLKQYQVAVADPYTALALTDDLPQDYTSEAHFNTRGTVMLGDRMAARLLSLRQDTGR